MAYHEFGTYWFLIPDYDLLLLKHSGLRRQLYTNFHTNVVFTATPFEVKEKKMSYGTVELLERFSLSPEVRV